MQSRGQRARRSQRRARKLSLKELMHLDFTNRVVIVTGAAQGIGQAIARAFRDSGAIEALSPSARHLWLWLWSYVDSRSGTARVSYETLAEKMGLKARMAKYLVKELLDRGFLEVATQGGPKRQSANTYRLHPIPASKGPLK